MCVVLQKKKFKWKKIGDSTVGVYINTCEDAACTQCKRKILVTDMMGFKNLNGVGNCTRVNQIGSVKAYCTGSEPPMASKAKRSEGSTIVLCAAAIFAIMLLWNKRN